jgi:hypothetical protein
VAPIAGVQSGRRPRMLDLHRGTTGPSKGCMLSHTSSASPIKSAVLRRRPTTSCSPRFRSSISTHLHLRRRHAARGWKRRSSAGSRSATSGPRFGARRRRS